MVRLFRETIDSKLQTRMMDALWNRDVQEAGRMISELLQSTISFKDYHEDYYHAFLEGAFAGMGYETFFHKEKGLGPDLLLKDEEHRRAIIIVAKKSQTESNLDKDCDEALEQIGKKRSAEGLYGYEHIFGFGVAFFRKQARVHTTRCEVKFQN